MWLVGAFGVNGGGGHGRSGQVVHEVTQGQHQYPLSWADHRPERPLLAYITRALVSESKDLSRIPPLCLLQIIPLLTQIYIHFFRFGTRRIVASVSHFDSQNPEL